MRTPYHNPHSQEPVILQRTSTIGRWYIGSGCALRFAHHRTAECRHWQPEVSVSDYIMIINVFDY